MSSVANLLAMDRTTLTAALKPLERRGLVKVTIGEKDRRSRLMTLTPEGLELLALAMPAWDATQAETAGLLGEGDPTALIESLRALS